MFMFYLYSFLRKSPESLGPSSIVIVHSTITIISFSLLCWKSCGTVKYIENLRVSNLSGSFWKRSLIYDVINDLPN